jgi:hypothetical protein
VPFDRCVEPRFLYSIGRGTLFDDRGALRDENAQVLPATGLRQRFYAPEDHVRERARERALEITTGRERRRHEKHGRRDERGTRTINAATVSIAAGCDSLRGGTPLVRVDENTWLGLGHEMKFVEGFKYYWHVWYVVDDRGRLKAASEPMKLATSGIEFAAGLAIDGDRVVTSFGVDDMESKIGETSLSAVLEKLTSVTEAP